MSSFCCYCCCCFSFLLGESRKLIKALASQSPANRFKIAHRYKEMFGKELKDVMKSECGSRDFGTCLQLLAVPSDEAECDIIELACKGMGTNEAIIYPVICGRSNKEIQLLKKRYFELKQKDLTTVLDRELGGVYDVLVNTCLQGMEKAYDPKYHTADKVQEDVAKLYSLGQGKWGTNEAELFKILCASPPAHLKKVNLAYAEKHDVTLYRVLEEELGGVSKDATLFLLGMKLVRSYHTKWSQPLANFQCWTLCCGERVIYRLRKKMTNLLK
jgi:hypothetical protein